MKLSEDAQFMVAVGICVALIFLGFGGCVRIVFGPCVQDSVQTSVVKTK